MKPVGCTFMVKELWLPSRLFYQLGLTVNLIDGVAYCPTEEVLTQLDIIRQMLVESLKDLGLELPVAVEFNIENLRNLVSERADEQKIRRAILQLREVAAEKIADILPKLIFKPEQVGGYAPEVLIHSQVDLLPAATWQVLSERATRDVIYAGAALAFRMATASAFHILRAVEDLQSDYYESCIPEKDIPRSKRTMGNMNKALESSGNANSDVINRIDDIKKNFRDPTMHPGAEYDMDKAIALFMEGRLALIRLAEALAISQRTES